jgi:serine/threonine-protein kinase
MATVYRCFDERLQVTRAVKILNPELTSKPRIRARFEAEARTMAVLDHTNIVRVYDVGSEGETVYIVMELVEGETLLDRIEGRGPIPDMKALEIIREMLRGLQAAHDQQIVHRDIKPHNILLSVDGRVRITDFGIAQSAHLTEESFTKTGAVMGTWAFMAPEQRVNSKGVDFRADIYGTGATMFAMVTQRTPMDLFAADLDPVMLRDVPPVVLPIIRKATRYQPDERYENSTEMLAAVELLLAQAPTRPQKIRTPPPVPRSSVPGKARPLPPAEATYLPDRVEGMVSAGTLRPTATAPKPAPILTPPKAPLKDARIDSGTLLPADEVGPAAADPERTHRARMLMGLMAILVMLAIGAVGRWVTRSSPPPAVPGVAEQAAPPPLIAPAEPRSPEGLIEVQPPPPEVEEPPPEVEKAPEVEEAPPEVEEAPPEVEEAPPEVEEAAAAPTTPGAGLRLLASPPGKGSIGDRLRFSARIPAADIREHRAYSVRMSVRSVGGGYRALEMKREGKVWHASITVTPEMAGGLEWCMFAKPDPGALPQHPKLTAVACNAPRRVTIRAR